MATIPFLGREMGAQGILKADRFLEVCQNGNLIQGKP
ncbi:hypothetical protein SLEP1_g25141 [Rubroshorea leprosula]|uniref:Uncharacterized protein n=1 Tax=Rubroshorea leprosula TaxID=152421 RepID=A0AAV5JI69_9ROSI|nr:hypothetical protein SLEP1_g25141 [Rubroshorea leprosula]